MQPSASPSSPPLGRPTAREEIIRRLPPAAREALSRFETAGDLQALDVVIGAVLGDFMPRAPASPLETQPGTTRLIEDLGFDSLAITELVFLMEDLFGICIGNEEILLVRTLDDLRNFIRGKVPVSVKG